MCYIVNGKVRHLNEQLKFYNLYPTNLCRFQFMEEKKEQCLKIASDCFTTVDQTINVGRHNTGDEDDAHDEKWLYHYMLGKIAEKRKELPEIFIDHYIKSAKFLYEHNASYPFKISHSNPQNLSVEALEIYYRITSSIIKHIEQHSTVTKAVGRFFIRILKEVNASPFAINKAKIDGNFNSFKIGFVFNLIFFLDNSINALKRKLSLANEEAAAKKLLRSIETNAMEMDINQVVEPTEAEQMDVDVSVPTIDIAQEIEEGHAIHIIPVQTERDGGHTILMENVITENENINSPSRRGSQESNATTTTTGTATTTTTGSDSTSSSSSNSSSSESSSSDDSESESSEDDAKVCFNIKLYFL